MRYNLSDLSIIKGITLVSVLTSIFLVAIPSSAVESQKSEDQAIMPNETIQAYLRALISTNKQVMFEGTEASVSEKFRQLRKMAGQDKDLVLQLIYFSAHTKNEREAMLPGVILEQLAVPNLIFVEVCLPLLDSNDEAVRKQASDWLSRADYNPKGGVDFSRYESILREKKENPPQGLIRYMYNRNPQAAVVTVSRVYGQDKSESEVAAKAKSGVKESVDYFSGRPEWWAHLYVAVMMEKEPYLQTPEMVKKLEQDPNPLVCEKVFKLKDKLQPK